jgi:L-lactate utilization protein LutB
VAGAFLLQPSPSLKRRKTAEILSGTPNPAPLNIEETKQRLTALRRDVVEHLPELVEQFRTTCAAGGQAEVAVARDVEDVVRRVERICGSVRCVAINNAATVKKELAPGLRQAGFRIIDSYPAQFPAFENRFQHYWEMPALEIDSLSLSFGEPLALDPLRDRATQQRQDFVAVLGVAAVSAEDGSLYFLQHSRNILDVYAQARAVILVVGLDKVTRRADDACFQTRCMGMFGAQAPLFDLPPGSAAAAVTEASPVTPAATSDQRVHIILLDNGRLQLRQGVGAELLTCIMCRRCIIYCPTYRYFRGPARWSPKEYVYWHFLGRNPSLDLCLLCGKCRVSCPIDIDIPGLIMRRREEQPRSLADTALAHFETMAKVGSKYAGLANWALASRVSRWVADRALHVSKQRHLPRFRRENFMQWFRSQAATQGKPDD